MGKIDLECHLIAYDDGLVFVKVPHIDKNHMGFGAFAKGPQVDEFVKFLKEHRQELEVKEKAQEG